MTPFLSLVTVAWNAAGTIADTMRSVAAQGFADYEHIVVDGASSDDTVAIAHAHASSRTHVVSEPDRGLYDAMNKGLARARGRYIGFLNADDFLVRTDALRLLADAAAAEPPAVSAAVVIVDAADPKHWRRSYSATHFHSWMLRFGHMPPHPGFYARRDLFTALGGFRLDLRISADFDWMLRFFAAGHRPVQMRQTLVAVREGGASNSGLASRRMIARETGRALRERGVRTAAPLLWGKYAAKAGQFLIPPNGYPAPAAVRWGPSTEAANA